MPIKIIAMRFQEIIHGLTVRRVAFFRDEDGMLLGAVQETIATMGDDPANMKRRVFIDYEHAVAWGQAFIRGMYSSRQEFEFEDRDGTGSRIVVPLQTEGRAN